MRGKQHELENIQVLRAIAAMLVIFVHLDHLTGLPGLGRGGVDLFFVISGFIMVYTTSNRAIGAGAFLWNRITRVAPLYWLVTGLVFVLLLLAPQTMPNTRAEAGPLLKSLLFIPFAKDNGEVFPLLYAGWTLNYEMFFYLLFAGGLLLRSRLAGMFLTAGLLLALVAAGMTGPFASPLLDFYSHPILLEFVAGMAAGLAFQRGASWPALPAAALWMVMVLGLLGLAFKDYIFQQQPDWVLGATGFGLVAVGAALALERQGRRPGMPLLVAIGDASYSLYLTQPFVAEVFQRMGSSLKTGSPAALLLAAACLATAAATGLGVYRLVERPLTRRARSLLAAPHMRSGGL